MHRPLTVLFAVLLGPLAVSQIQAQDALDSDRTVIVHGHFSMALPASLELDAGTFRSVPDGDREILVVDIEKNPVVVQPAGTNALEQPPDGPPDAAILIATEIGEPGAYAELGADLAISEEELKAVDAQLHAGFAQESSERGDMHDISWAGTDVVQLEQTQAIRVRFTGTEGKGDRRFVVNIYMIQNNDTMYYLTITYSVADQEKWVADLEKTVASLQFESRSG